MSDKPRYRIPLALMWSAARVVPANEYERRREAKIARFEEYATKARGRAEEAHSRGREIADVIPFGQPILAGHHSERRHRRDLDRIDRSLQTMVEEQRKADYWGRRAEAARNDTSIRRGDPEAVRKLEAKIAELEAAHARRKAINRAIGRACHLEHSMSPEEVQQAFERYAYLGFTEQEKRDLELHARFNRMFGYPPYALQNLAANLRRYRDRLASLRPKPPEN